MNYFLEQSSSRIFARRDEVHSTIHNEKQWEWDFLRKKCRNLEVEDFYEDYMHRMRLAYLTLFICIQAFVLGVHSLVMLVLLLSTYNKPENLLPDVLLYATAPVLVWLILSVNYKEKFMKRYPWMMYSTSWAAITILVFADLGVPAFHAFWSHDILLPIYGSFILYAVYIFMPLPENVHAILLGLAVTASYLICFALITFRREVGNIAKIDKEKLISEAIFLVIINLIGLYFRIMKEIAIRTTFLDRRQCVEENLLLRFARDQEKALLLSIIPARIANKIEQDVRLRIEHLKLQSKLGTSDTGITRKLFIEPHNDVTILYADVVNYTYLTTTLDVKTLVETLHDLFVRFDQASEENNVLRIKFLGDCYYCVAGVPIPNESHARCCVELGLQMIKDIREVRIKRKLNVDMRIGVHSGNILSGVIGACKWQFDIWSKDVDIANRLEQTGMAGRVHVSEQTLKLLDGEYMYEEGTRTARADEVLRKYRVHTFLIKPPRYLAYSDLLRPPSGVRRQIHSRWHHRPDVKMNFMQNTIVQYNQIRTQSKLEMSREVDKMPIGRIQLSKLFKAGTARRLTQDEMEEEGFRNNITAICLCFREMRWECLYMRQPDILLKFSVLLAVITFFGLMAIEAINTVCAGYRIFFCAVRYAPSILCSMPWSLMLQDDPPELRTMRLLMVLPPQAMYVYAGECPSAINRPQRHQGSLQQHHLPSPQTLCFWNFAITNSCVLLAILLLVWFKKLYIMFWSEADYAAPPRNKIATFFFNMSDTLQTHLGARICMFGMVLFAYASCLLLTVKTQCNEWKAYSGDSDILLVEEGFNSADCFNPWAITEILVLIICINFIFTRIPFALKFALAMVILLICTIWVFWEYDFVYEKSRSTNIALIPEVAHMLIILLAIGIFHLMDRQTEFISKVDYNWKRQLQKKQDDAKITNETIKVLINNILPSHVADIYMTKKMKNELYYEEYENVSVMFATIRNYDTEKVGLRVLNEIICDFDEVLARYQGPLKIEKIKVAGWTYMAACGLDLTRVESITSQTSFRNSSLLPNGRRSYNTPNEGSSSWYGYQSYEGHTGRLRKISNPRQHSVVFVLAQFALELMKTMHHFTIDFDTEEDEIDQGMLRIGISNGAVMAGVVGSYKPHYDIWGNAVNMASRMDSTGRPGYIQVTRNTARILETFNIRCVFRGLTYVKGRGQVPTYFIDLDENVNFVKVKREGEELV